MKSILYKSTTLLIALFMVYSCEESDATVDFILDGTTRGAILKTIEVKSPVVDINDIANSFFAVEVEYRDHENNELLESVDVYASFIDNTDDGVDNSTPESFVTNIPDSEFAIDDTYGNPRADLVVPAAETFAALGLTEDQLNGGDVLFFRLVLKLKDGREFTNNTNGNVAGGSFFSSPFQYAATLVCLFDEPGFFSGQYMLEQLTGSDPFFGTQTFGTQQIEITANGVERSFNFVYYPGIFDSNYIMNLNLVCGNILVEGKIAAGGLGCGSNIGQATPDVPSTFDEDLVDDAVIELKLLDFDPDGDCGTGSYPVTLRLTKMGG